MRSNARGLHYPRVRHLITILLLLGLVSLACSLSPRPASAPLFNPPGGVNNPTNAPPETLIPFFATPTPTLSNSTPDPPAAPTETLTPTPPLVNTTPILYYTQAGDTLPVVAVRFGVDPSEITSPNPIPRTALLNPGQLLFVPHRLANTTSSQHLMPDSEVVFSPSSLDFDLAVFIDQAGGYLTTYEQYL